MRGFFIVVSNPQFRALATQSPITKVKHLIHKNI